MDMNGQGKYVIAVCALWILLIYELLMLTVNYIRQCWRAEQLSRAARSGQQGSNRGPSPRIAGPGKKSSRIFISPGSGLRLRATGLGLGGVGGNQSGSAPGGGMSSIGNARSSWAEPPRFYMRGRDNFCSRRYRYPAGSLTKPSLENWSSWPQRVEDAGIDLRPGGLRQQGLSHPQQGSASGSPQGSPLDTPLPEQRTVFSFDSVSSSSSRSSMPGEVRFGQRASKDRLHPWSHLRQQHTSSVSLESDA